MEGPVVDAHGQALHPVPTEGLRHHNTREVLEEPSLVPWTGK